MSRGQEFVIGSYTFGTKTFDALVFGIYEKGQAAVRRAHPQWLQAATRVGLFKKFKGLGIAECPFANLPVLIAQTEFLEWTADDHLRCSKFVGLREDKKAMDVVRE